MASVLNFQFLDKTQILGSQLFQQATDWLVQTYQQSRKVFSSSSAMGQLLSVQSDLQNLNLYYIEDSITEMNFNTATREANVAGLTRLVGYNPTRAIAAQGQLTLKWNGNNADIAGKQIFVLNYSKIQCTTNNQPYIFLFNSDSLTLELDKNLSYTANIIQGELEDQVFNGTGLDNQSYYVEVTGLDVVDNFWVKVYVNGIQWTIYDEFQDMPLGKAACVIKTGVLPGIDLYFGNEFFGQVPIDGAEIRVQYIKTSGTSGNVRPGQSVSWNFQDTGFTQFGDEIDLNDTISVATAISPYLGSDSEDVDTIRIAAPRFSRSYVFANPDNYIIFFEKFNTYSIVDSWKLDDDLDVTNDNIIYILLVPDVTKRLNSGETYFDTPVSSFTLTELEITKLTQLLNQSGSQIVTTNVQFVNVNLKKYVLNINLKIFEGYDENGGVELKRQIVDAISSYMLTFSRRDQIPRSDLIAIVENVTGVDSASVFFLSQDNETFKTTSSNALLPDLGIDEFGDIIINKGEVPIIRGGWADRNGVFYDEGLNYSKPSSVNIQIKGITKLSYLSQKQLNLR